MALILVLSLAGGCRGTSNKQLISELKNKDWRVRAKAAVELGERRNTKAVAPLIAAIRDEDADVVDAAGKALAMIGPSAVPELIQAMKDDTFCFNTEPDIAGASKVLVMIGKSASGPVIASLKNEDYRIRVNAAKVLGEIGDPQAVVPLCAAMKDEVWRVRVNARWALEKIGKPSVDKLISLLSSNDPTDRESAAMALGKIKDQRAIPALRTAFKEDKSELVRVNAALSLGELQDRDSIDLLIAALSEKKRLVRPSSLMTALKGLTGQDFGDNPEQWLKWRKENP